jgi:hypothetical protein
MATELEAKDTQRRKVELLVVLVIGAAILIFMIQDMIRAAASPPKGTSGFIALFDRFMVGVAAICTIVIYSFLYRENPFYRFLEHVLVGLSVGYYTMLTWTNLLEPNWWDKLVGNQGLPPNPLWILAVFPGLLWYFQLSRKKVWLSRIVIMFFMGTGAGLAFKGVFNMLLTPGVGQIQTSFKPFFTRMAGSWIMTWTNVFNMLFVVVMLCVLSYFFFSFRHDKVKILPYTSRLGRYFLMICFGTIFGTTVQGRMSLFIDRLTFLYTEWLKVLAG